jgi:uncharacterized protein
VPTHVLQGAGNVTFALPPQASTTNLFTHVPIEIQTPHGPARAHLNASHNPRAAIVLGHGAGGGIGAADLTAAAEAAQALGLSVVLVEQPYRVAGRRSPAPAKQLDAAWLAVLERLRKRELASLELVTGGRSSGARVACRTAAPAEAVGVLCLAFPVHPPGRSDPALSRLPELELVSAPVLVVQGESDPFGIPPAAENRRVVTVPGNHSLRAAKDEVKTAVSEWLRALLGAQAARR